MTKPLPRVTVFRVENNGKYGAYEGAGIGLHCDDKFPCETGSRHPTFSGDQGFQVKNIISPYEIPFYGKHRFGFESLKAFHAWFYSMYAKKLLKERGMKLSEYQVIEKYVIRGDKQLVFNITKAKLIERYDLETLEK